MGGSRETMSQVWQATGFMNLTFVECLLSGLFEQRWIEMIDDSARGQ